MSQAAMAISLFFHILATAIWIGGILLITALVVPEFNRIVADQLALYSILLRIRKRFAQISNLALAVLIVTGLLQMTADPNYDGLLQFNSEWSQVLLIKHLSDCRYGSGRPDLAIWHRARFGKGQPLAAARKRR